MIGAIKPPRAGDKNSWLLPASLYTLGATTSAALLGITVAALGSAIHLDQHVSTAIPAIGILCLGLLPMELGVNGFRVPGFQRQTVKFWRDRYGERWSALFWGMHLGLGVLTIRVTSLFWIALLLFASSGSMLVSATFLIYGVGLGLNLVVAGLVLEGGDFGRPVAALNLLPRVRLFSTFAVSLLGVLLIASGTLADST